MLPKDPKSSFKKLDAFFSGDTEVAPKNKTSKHAKKIRRFKLLLPSIAAGLLGLLIIYPKIMQDSREFGLDITKPKKGELEKLHIENTVFYITDKENKVHNFIAENIDETEPGSKLIKINNPEGTLPADLTAWFNIKAPTGYYDQNGNFLELKDNVEMFYSEGMNLEVPDLTYDFNQSKGYSHSPIKADGFLGKLQSQGFEFFSDTGVLVFKGKTYISIKEDRLKERNQ